GNKCWFWRLKTKVGRAFRIARVFDSTWRARTGWLSQRLDWTRGPLPCPWQTEDYSNRLASADRLGAHHSSGPIRDPLTYPISAFSRISLLRLPVDWEASLLVTPPSGDGGLCSYWPDECSLGADPRLIWSSLATTFRKQVLGLSAESPVTEEVETLRGFSANLFIDISGSQLGSPGGTPVEAARGISGDGSGGEMVEAVGAVVGRRMTSPPSSCLMTSSGRPQYFLEEVTACNSLALALPAPPPMSEDLCAAVALVEEASQGEESVPVDNGKLSKGEIMDILSKVENFMETQVYMVELYQDTLVDLLLPRNAKRLKLEIKKDTKLSFVDLAGSERVKKSGSSGHQLKEAQSINKSLSALGDVIGALSSDGQHIPYRNHKLTMLMSDSLGGNAKTLMFVNVSPAESNLEETHNSLIYASRVRSIVNDPSKNVSSKEVARLKKLVSYWKEQAGKRGDDEELEEIQEERPARDRMDMRLST
ncbi:hypothetical protein Taro_056028, partial [Colocasia esculenta]|nr:hypothetical protein [Colocasia esculenta]